MKKLVLVMAMVGVATVAGAWTSTPFVGGTAFFAEDIFYGSPGVDNNHLASWPNSAALQSFILGSVDPLTQDSGTENFELIPVGTSAPLVLDFQTAGTALLSGNSGGQVRTQFYISHYATSGTHYWDTYNGFTIDFSETISLFGFYGVDVGDFGGHMTIAVSDNGSSVANLNVGNSTSPNGEYGGSVLYYAIYCPGGFDRLVFGNTYTSGDSFAFDDMFIATQEQIIHPPTDTPEPATLVLLGLGAGIGLVRRFRKTA